MHPATTPAPPRRSGRSRRTLLSAALALLAALLLTPALAQAAGGDAAGTWVGAIEIPGAPLGVQVTLAEGEPWTGTIDIPAQGAVGIPLEPVSVDAAGVTFVIAGVPGQATFQGAVDGDTLSGSFTQAGQAFPFTLERAEASDAASAAPTPGPDVEASAGEHADPQGRFTIAVPTGWSASERDGYLRVEGPEGPEGRMHVDVVVSPGSDPEAAVAEAWALTAPDLELEEAQRFEPPSSPGVDRTFVATYESADPDQVFQALAQVVGDETYTLLIYGDLAMLQRRGAQLDIVATSFTITAVEGSDLSQVEPRSAESVLGELRDYLTWAMDAYGVPGVSLAVVQGGEVVHVEGFGVTQAGGSEPVTPDTQMMIGSVGKTITSMLVASLVDDGALGWDTPVVDLLPRFAVADEELTQRITVRDLLCACSGVPRRDLELAFNYDELTAERVVESLRGFEFFTGFGEAFQYSNQLVATAGYAAATAAGAPYGELFEGYESVLEERLLGPIGMAATTLDEEAVVRRGQHGSPHQLDIESGEYRPIDLAYEGLVYPVGPAGAHWSTANDMARYLITVLSLGVAPDGARVVSEENLLVTWEPQVAVSATDSYGLGWIVSDYHGLPMLSHSGSTLGFSSDMVFLPDADLGVIVLANAQAANAFTSSVALRLVELVYDQPSSVQAQTEFQVQQIAQALTEARQQLQDRVPLAAALRYYGAYTNPALGDVSLRIEDGQLVFDAGEWRAQVRPTATDADGEASGFVTYGGPYTGLSLRFEEGEAGATTLVIGNGIVSYAFERVR